MTDETNNISSRLTSGRVLARSTILNFIGQGLPLVVAIFAIPIIIKALGPVRFGVLTLAWALIGYFSLFDIGLGRALTQLVAKKLGLGHEEDLPVLVWTCLFLMIILGMVGGLVLSLLSPWLVHRILKIPVALQPDTLHAFYLLAVFIPVVTSTAGLRGILEAQQRFGFISTVRITMGLLTYLSPLLILPFSTRLFPLVAILAVFRMLAWLAYLLLCFYVVPSLRQGIIVRRAVVVPLLRFGGWISVSNIIDPFMVYLDRFLIGAVISISAVTYYVTPYEVVTKLWLIAGSMVGVLFPAFATSSVKDRKRTALLFGRGVKYIFLTLFPITLLIVTLAKEGLVLWLGEEFATQSTRVLQWLALGVFINSMAQTPNALIQGMGRPDLTAILHLFELPLYLLGVWWMINVYGIEGAAIAWTVRILVDTLILFWMAWWLLPSCAPTIRRISPTIGIALPALAFPMFSMDINIHGVFLLLMIPVFTLTAWFYILAPEERLVVQDWFKTAHVFKWK